MWHLNEPVSVVHLRVYWDLQNDFLACPPSFCGHGCITWHGVDFIVKQNIQMNLEVLCLPNFFRSNILSRFSRPILHGLCTLGFAVRAIIKCICRGDPNLIKSISARFLLHVYPGETLITEMWLEGFR